MVSDKITSNKMMMLGKLTARFTHELRNPLSAIKLNLDYLKMFEEDLPEDVMEIVCTTREAFDRVQYLIESILEFSRQNYESTSKCDINEVSVQAINLVKGTPRSNGLLFETDFEEDIPLLQCDKNSILQVFLNLITNAVEACEGTGLITIKTFRNGDNTFIWSIKDNGVGIEGDDQSKIFFDFFTKKSNGTGLGLGVCKEILEEKNAELTFESESGKGTTFYIKFKPDKEKINAELPGKSTYNR